MYADLGSLVVRVPPASASPPAGRELYRDVYITVHLAQDGQLIRITRSAQVYPDIPSLLQSFEGVLAALDRAGRRGRAMLFDTRAPQGRNDPAFERAMAGLRPHIDRQFARIGVLVRSAMGALQIRRLAGEDGIERIIGTDEREVIDTLLAGLPSRRS